MKAELIKRIINFKDKRRYEGETLFGAPCGEGKLYNKNNKLIYSGHWMAGLPHGKGEYINADDDVYKGLFQYGYQHGHCAVYNEMGDFIEDGLWQFGKKCEKEVEFSKLEVKNATRIDELQLPMFKKFYNQIKIGKAVKNADYTVYIGNLQLGKLTDMAYAETKTGLAFLGNSKNNVRTGKGVFAFPNGEVYMGDFNDDWRTGDGLYYWNNGDWYDGEWLEGQREGQGQYYSYAEKRTYEGNWKNNKKSGEFKVYDENGEIILKEKYLKDELLKSSKILIDKETFSGLEETAGSAKNKSEKIFYGKEIDGVKTGWGVLHQPNNKQKTYIVANFENGNPTDYVEIYDKDFRLTLAGIIDDNKKFNGYATQIKGKLFRETFYNESEKLSYDITTKNFETPKRVSGISYSVKTFDFNMTSNNTLRTDGLDNLIEEYTKMNYEKIQNQEHFQKRKELFLTRRKEVVKIFSKIENLDRQPIEKYLNPNYKAPIVNNKKEVEKIMNKTNINSQKEMEAFIDKKFEDLIGLENVKEQLKNIFALKVMQGDNYKLSDMNMAFIGNPGTGKSTVANIVTETLYEMGIIKENNCVNVSFKDLYGAYVGHSLKAINEQIAKAKGGVLFLDEAHQLSIDSPQANNNFSKEIINALITALETNRENTVFIFAGYKKEMKEMLNKTDRGLTSRIGRVVEFEDFQMEDLAILFTRMLAEQKNYQNMPFSITDDALGSILYLLMDIKKEQGGNFGNAREVRVLVRKVLEGFARVNTDKNRTLITNIDLDDMFKGKIKLAGLEEKDERDFS